MSQRIGSKIQVWNGTALKTSGGLKRSDLKLNKNGKLVSKRASAAAKQRYEANKKSLAAKGFRPKTKAQLAAMRAKRRQTGGSGSGYGSHVQKHMTGGGNKHVGGGPFLAMSYGIRKIRQQTGGGDKEIKAKKNELNQYKKQLLEKLRRSSDRSDRMEIKVALNNIQMELLDIEMEEDVYSSDDEWDSDSD